MNTLNSPPQVQPDAVVTPTWFSQPRVLALAGIILFLVALLLPFAKFEFTIYSQLLLGTDVQVVDEELTFLQVLGSPFNDMIGYFYRNYGSVGLSSYGRDELSERGLYAAIPLFGIPFSLILLSNAPLFSRYRFVLAPIAIILLLLLIGLMIDSHISGVHVGIFAYLLGLGAWLTAGFIQL